MKFSIVVTAILALLALGSLPAQNKTEPECSQARFRIVPADYLHLGKGASLKEAGVFKLDTMTGQTWRFVSFEDNTGKIHEAWDEIK